MNIKPSTNFLRLVLVCAGVTWGLTIAVTPWQTESGWHSLPLIFWQSVVSVIVLLPWAWYKRRTLSGHWKVILFFAIMGLAGTAIPQVLSLESGKHLAGSVRSVMFALIPMVSLGFGLMLKTETVTWQKVVGMALGFIAILILFGPGSTTGGLGGVALPILWFGIMIAVVALYAFENNWIKLAMPKGMDPLIALFGANLAAVLFLLPTLLGPYEWIWLPLEFSGIHARPTAMFWMTMFIQLAAYAGFVYCIDKGGPAFAGQVSYIVTASGFVWAVILLGDRPNLWVLLALFVVLGGIALVKPNDYGDDADTGQTN